MAFSFLTAVLLTACSANNITGEPVIDVGGTSSFEQDAPAVPVGPLDEFTVRIFGGLQDGGPTEIDRQEAAINRALAQFVARCMAAQGFNFIAGDSLPNVGIGLGRPAVEESDGPVFGTREWAELYGFGFSTDPWSDTAAVHTAGRETDPNLAQVNAMSDAERVAWDLALVGEQPNFNNMDENEMDAWFAENPAGLGGCSGQALAAYFPMMTADEQWVGLRDEMNRLRSVVAADPRMFELQVAWASCMAEHGIAARPDRDEFWFTDVQNEWFAINGQDVLLTWDWENRPEGPPEPDRSQIPAFREREIMMAVADYDCQHQVNWAATSRAIDFDHQQQFVELHRNELEAWAQEMEARREGWNW